MVRKVINDNKFMSIVIGILLTSLIGWGGWVTGNVFSNKENVNVNKAMIEVMKVDITDIKIELKTLAEKSVDNQEQIIRLLKADRKSLRKT